MLLYIKHFVELGPCVCNKLKKMLFGLEFHEIIQHILKKFGQFLC